MSNKLKTLAPSQLEHFIKEKVDEYIGAKCSCEVSNMNVPNIDSEADIGMENKRSISFEVKLAYFEEGE